MNHEDYIFFKQLGICVHCRKNKAEKGKVLCLACARDNVQLGRKRTWTKEQSDKAKIEYARRKSLGLCTNCGKYASRYGLLCTRCYTTIRLRKERTRDKKIPRSERPDYGLCYICGEADLVQGRKICHECYETRLSSVGKIMHLPKGRKKVMWS